MKPILTAVVLLGLLAGPVHAQSAGATGPSDAEITAQLQLAQAYVGAGKRTFIDEQLALTADEAKAFWPIYDAYQEDLADFNRRRLDNVMAYARAWNAGQVTEDDAASLAAEAVAIEVAEADALKRVHRKLKRAVPMLKAARYLQVEYKLRAIVRFEQAARVPFMPAGG